MQALTSLASAVLPSILSYVGGKFMGSNIGRAAGAKYNRFKNRVNRVAATPVMQSIMSAGKKAICDKKGKKIRKARRAPPPPPPPPPIE